MSIFQSSLIHIIIHPDASVPNLFHLAISLNCTNIEKNFFLFFTQRVSFGTSYFTATPLLNKPYFKSIKALFFVQRVLFCIFFLPNIIVYNFFQFFFKTIYTWKVKARFKCFWNSCEKFEITVVCSSVDQKR